jgi:hypothetical protein
VVCLHKAERKYHSISAVKATAAVVRIADSYLARKGNFMAANPNMVVVTKVALKKQTLELCEPPKPISLKKRVRDLLLKIFKGHEEFAGWTPD